MSQQIIECVPNFSEGQNPEVIEQIAAVIRGVEGVQLLNVDPGYDTNRTVMTFLGEASAVVEAAFLAVAKSQELIDMRNHKGTHPRLGSTDVLPLIPISGITMEQCVELARALARRISEELLIPTYCYQEAAFTPERRNLAVCRRGEYEALPRRLTDLREAPDFGARSFDEIIARSGAVNVGARDFLIAVNFNLNTKSSKIATQIACDVRESGRKVVGPDGESVTRHGLLKACKAIGWYIEEYGFAQVSMNLTDISVTSLHVAFEGVKCAAALRGVEVTGTEIIGLVPERVLLDAGRYFALKQGEVCENRAELFDYAVRNMGLDELGPYDVSRRVILSNS